METAQIIALLEAERGRLDNAIEALQVPMKRRGRPVESAGNTASVDAPATTAPKRKGRKFSAAQRKAAAERMRQIWAAKKKAEAKVTKKVASKPKSTAKAAQVSADV